MSLISEALGSLIGDWAGEGSGRYPTIAPFVYREALRFILDDEARPVLRYEQKTERRDKVAGVWVSSHWETGFVHLLPDKQVQIINAQAGGRVEVLAGSIEQTLSGLVLRLESAYLGNDPRMIASTRVITVSGDQLHYTMHMRTNSNPPLDQHLEATLQRFERTS